MRLAHSESYEPDPFLLGIFISGNFAMRGHQNGNSSRLETSAAPKNAQNSEFL